MFFLWGLRPHAPISDEHALRAARARPPAPEFLTGCLWGALPPTPPVGSGARRETIEPASTPEEEPGKAASGPLSLGERVGVRGTP